MKLLSYLLCFCYVVMDLGGAIGEWLRAAPDTVRRRTRAWYRALGMGGWPYKGDKYDRAIQWLLEQPDFDKATHNSWTDGGIARVPGQYDLNLRSPAACLFAFCVPYGKRTTEGCLTQIRAGDARQSYWPALTAAIQVDTRIPAYLYDIQPVHLPVFAEYQRIIDVLCGSCRLSPEEVTAELIEKIREERQTPSDLGWDTRVPLDAGNDGEHRWAMPGV